MKIYLFFFQLIHNFAHSSYLILCKLKETLLYVFLTIYNCFTLIYLSFKKNGFWFTIYIIDT